MRVDSSESSPVLGRKQFFMAEAGKDQSVGPASKAQVKLPADEPDLPHLRYRSLHIEGHRGDVEGIFFGRM